MWYNQRAVDTTALVVQIVATLVTLGLAYAAFRAIKQNWTIHRHEKRERILNEIIEWGIDIAKCESESEVGVVPPDVVGWESAVQVNYIRHLNAVDHQKLQFRYQAVDARTEYIKSIVDGSPFSATLGLAAKEAADTLGEHIVVLHKLVRDEVSVEDYEIDRLRVLYAAVALIQRAAKLKTDEVLSA